MTPFFTISPPTTTSNQLCYSSNHEPRLIKSGVQAGKDSWVRFWLAASQLSLFSRLLKSTSNSMWLHLCITTDTDQPGTHRSRYHCNSTADQVRRNLPHGKILLMRFLHVSQCLQRSRSQGTTNGTIIHSAQSLCVGTGVMMTGQRELPESGHSSSCQKLRFP